MVIPRRIVFNIFVPQHIGNAAELAADREKLGILQMNVPIMMKIGTLARKKLIQRLMVYS